MARKLDIAPYVREDKRKVDMIPHKEKTVTVSVDTYLLDADGKAVPAHGTYQVTYCEYANCMMIQNVTADVDTLTTREVCVEGAVKGVCGKCGRPVARPVMNDEKMYKVGEEFKPLANNIVIQ